MFGLEKLLLLYWTFFVDNQKNQCIFAGILDITCNTKMRNIIKKKSMQRKMQCNKKQEKLFFIP